MVIPSHRYDQGGERSLSFSRFCEASFRMLRTRSRSIRPGRPCRSSPTAGASRQGAVFVGAPTSAVGEGGAWANGRGAKVAYLFLRYGQTSHGGVGSGTREARAARQTFAHTRGIAGAAFNESPGRGDLPPNPSLQRTTPGRSPGCGR